jgi:hypothetical protein
MLNILPPHLQYLLGLPDRHQNLSSQAPLFLDTCISQVHKSERLRFAKFYASRVTVTELALNQLLFYKVVGYRSKWAGLKAEFTADAAGLIQFDASIPGISR